MLKCFSIYLNFLNGRRCSPLFRIGVVNKEELWYDCTPYLSDQYKSVFSWVPSSSSDGLNGLWEAFSSLWKEEEDFLVAVIHWYNEANALAGFTDGAIIMTQTALELIYNWLLVEQKKFIIGKDAESISASNKIRLLLSLLNVDNEVPSCLSNLKKLVEENKEIVDGPEAFVQIRNAVVHSQASKRKKISNMDSIVKFEVLQLSLWYIELAILYLLNYRSQYNNRCFYNINQGDILVPWAKEHQ